MLVLNSFYVVIHAWRGDGSFVSLASWLIKMSKRCVFRVYTTEIIAWKIQCSKTGVSCVFLCCRWDTRTPGLWSSWWTNMASTTLLKSTPASRWNTQSLKKSLSKWQMLKNMNGLCVIHLQTGVQLQGQMIPTLKSLEQREQKLEFKRRLQAQKRKEWR